MPNAPILTPCQVQPVTELTAAQLLELIDERKISLHKLEEHLGDATRAVDIRRAHTKRALKLAGLGTPLDRLPYRSFNEDEFYTSIEGTNCEAVIGFVLIQLL